MKNKISIIVPVYNEEKSIGKVLDGIRRVMKKVKNKYEIIVVDDASTDRSAKIIKKRKVKMIKHSNNKGYGAALKSGIKNAKGTYILIIDADGSYPVNEIPRLIQLSSKYDMVVGARTGTRIEVPLLRRPAKWLLNKLTNYLSGLDIPDINSGLRIFKKEIALRFFSLFPDGFSFTVTITLASLTNDYNVKFIPINYYKRKGKSSINPIKDFTGFIYLIIRMIVYFKPLNVFLPISFFLFTIGFIKAIRDFMLFNYFGLGGVTVILTAVQIAFLGLIADLIIKRTKL